MLKTTPPKKSLPTPSKPTCACVHILMAGVTNCTMVLNVQCFKVVYFCNDSRSPCGRARMPRWERAGLVDSLPGWEQRDAPYPLDLAVRSRCHQTSRSHNRSFYHHRHSLESPPRNESTNTPPYSSRGERGKLGLIMNRKNKTKSVMHSVPRRRLLQDLKGYRMLLPLLFECVSHVLLPLFRRPQVGLTTVSVSVKMCWKWTKNNREGSWMGYVEA